LRTARVTFLTSPDQKAALDAYAARNGQSVGHVLREASVRYMVEEQATDEAVAFMVSELEDALPHMQRAFESIERSIAESRAALKDMREYFASKPR
jgi:hypothetical protein